MMRLEPCEDKQAWDDLVHASPQGSVFCTSAFLDAYADVYELFFVVVDDTPRLGAVLVLDDEGNPVSEPIMHHGVLLPGEVAALPHHKKPPVIHRLVEFLMAELEEKYGRFAFSMHPTFEDLRPFQWFHYGEQNPVTTDLRYTGILDLQRFTNDDDVLAAARTIRRRDFRSAEKLGYKVIESHDATVLDDLHESVFVRQGRTRTPDEMRLTRQVARAAIGGGFGRLVLSVNADECPVAASLFLLDGRCGYNLIHATDSDHRKSGVGTQVLFAQIFECIKRGIETVDFVGINSPNRGDFKISFNAEPVAVFDLRWGFHNG